VINFRSNRLLVFLVTVFCLSVVSGCSTTFLWKTVDDPKWGLRFKIPASIQEKNFETSQTWIHEGDGLKVIVDFAKAFSEEELKTKKNYTASNVSQSNLNAVICTYGELRNSSNETLKIAELYFLEKRQVLGAPFEPSFRVEYQLDDQLDTAMRILYSVELYESN